MVRLVGIEYLRACAATAVMLFHYALASGYSGALVALGQFGVDVFFVISGFIMWTVSRDEASPAGFLLRRIVRIAPLYWLATLAAALVTTEGGVTLGLGAPAGDLAKALFFIPAYSARSPDVVEPILSVGWTLNLEMAFYALFAASLAAPRRRRLIVLVRSEEHTSEIQSPCKRWASWDLPAPPSATRTVPCADCYGVGRLR